MTFQSCGAVPVALAHDVGIAIRSTDAERRLMHVGLVYRDTEGDQRFIHLAFHYDLRDEPAPSSAAYLWADCNWLGAPEADLKRDIITSFIESVREEAKVPYGFDASGTHFDGGGQFISLDPSKGLTCATFVASVFESAGFPVVDLATWEKRSDDEVWRAILMDVLQHHAPERAAQVAGSAMEFRLRPDEIAAASCGSDVPIPFPQAVAAAEPIRDVLFPAG